MHIVVDRILRNRRARACNNNTLGARQKSNAMAQTSYCSGAYSKIRAALEAESNTTL